MFLSKTSASPPTNDIRSYTSTAKFLKARHEFQRTRSTNIGDESSASTKRTRIMKFTNPSEIAPGVQVITINGDRSQCHLLVEDGATLLVNCIDGLTPAMIEQAGYPSPTEIWHTQVDNSLAAEGDAFPDAVTRLPRKFSDLAAVSEDYWKAARVRWERPEAWMEELGRAAYGIAGSLILQPLDRPLTGFQTFESGVSLSWRHLDFEVWDFSVRNFYAVGFALRMGEKLVALFAGELVDGDGNLPDAHGFEADYSGPPWGHIAATIKQAASREPQWLFPATGPSSPHGTSLLTQLASRIEVFTQTHLPEAPWVEEPAPIRYRDHGDSVFQMAAHFGNVILLINPAGEGLMIDPGPCDYGNPRRKEDFIADLERFESEAGLNKIDLALVTHFHGDHYDLWPVLKARYPACRLGAWLPVADVITHPETYPYACQLPWYGLDWSHCQVDVVLTRQQPLDWHGTAIHTVFLPGHCLVHAGYWLDWKGRRILFSGDSIQTRGGVDNLQLLISNHSVPGTGEGHLTAYENVIPLGITLNLGGHGSSFENCDKIYRASYQRIEATTKSLLGLFGPKHPSDIFLRESFRPAAEKVRKLMAAS